MDPAVDKLWLFTATLLILLMQVGFLLLEGGRVRSKNAINVAQKNVSDLMVCWIAFILFGFTVMFGAQMPASGDAYPSPLDFMFQLGFCATAASIISGGIAERMSFRAYLVLALLIGGFLYPITGRLVWGNHYDTGVTAWLADLGFVDFAGSTVVHSVGAWAALVGILFIGPRTDRFDAAGKPRVMASHSSIMSLHGVMLLMLGWLGFNAGAVSVSDPAFSQILMNTLSAAAFGSAGGSIIGLWLDKGVFNPSRTMNGIIGGLVCCTAAVHVMSPYEAMFAGLSGGALATGAAHYLLFRLRFDDPVDVVATHGLAGVYGTLLYAFVAPSSALVNGSQLSQFAIQATGVILVFIMITSGTWATLTLTGRYVPLRVKPEEEALGLNYTEHGEAIGTDRLRNALQGQIEGTSGFTRAIELDQHDEHADLAAAVNTLIVRQEEVTEEIRQSEQRFRQFAATASDWLWECDREGKLVSVDVADAHYAQIGSLDWSSLTLFEFANVLPENDLIVRTAMNRGSSFGPIDGSINSRNADSGETTHLLVEFRGTPHRNGSGVLLGYRGTISDVTSRKTAENQAIYLAQHDALTGLTNRRALESGLPDILAESRKELRAVVVAVIDLDGFKAVNDAYGHAVGDGLLRQVATRLSAEMSDNQHLYRTGGDEFVMVLHDMDVHTAREQSTHLMTRALSLLSTPFSVESLALNIGSSIGLAMYPTQGIQPDDLLRKADLAMYSAKTRGKGRCVWFESSMDVESQHRFRMEKEVDRAIENNEFYLVYQPLVDSTTETLNAFEALLRWKHPERGELAPTEFISIAERHNLMERIGNFVLEEACRFASTWNVSENQMMPRIVVNVAPSQLSNPEFTANVLQTLTQLALPPERLELEITEEVLIQNHQQAITTIKELQAAGIAMSIDDFGSGQTSLSYLSQFPVTTLKIDRAFIRDLGKDARATEITRSMIAMGSRLGYSIVVEGVERSDQSELLKAWNCTLLQGYLFSKPIAAEDALSMIYNDGQAEGLSRKAG